MGLPLVRKSAYAFAKYVTNKLTKPGRKLEVLDKFNYFEKKEK